MSSEQESDPADSVNAVEYDDKDFRFSDPHSDPIPRDIAEVALKECSGSEFKILYAIIRKTVGFKKADDRISLSQIQDATNLTRPTVIKGLESLEKEHWIISVKEKNQIWYAPTLNPRVVKYFYQYPFKGSKKFLLGWLKFFTKIEKIVVKKLDPQETVLEETIKETGVASPKQTQLQVLYLWERLYGKKRAVEKIKQEFQVIEAEVLEYVKQNGFPEEAKELLGVAHELDKETNNAAALDSSKRRPESA